MAEPGQYDNGNEPTYEDESQPQPQPEAQAPTQHTGRRKRQYAGQAYEFGTGGPQTQPQPGESFSGGTYDGYNAQAEAQTFQQTPYGPQYGASPNPPPPGFGPSPQQAYGQNVGGYQPPDAGYPESGAAPSQGGVAGITQGMSNMSTAAPPPPPQQQAEYRPHLNQLYPTDMLSQPFHVSELDTPPPAIVLPPNVSFRANTTGRNRFC
jgi:protein transport protein SEC24